MDYSTLKGFDEKYARVTVKQHKTFDGKVIEVLYGAQDAEGNPIPPKAVGEDGCGRWYGIESNGVTTMLVWQHPACDGGAIEFGTDEKEEAFEALVNTMKEKMNICKEIDGIANEGNTSKEEEFKQLKEKYNALKDWNTSKEEEFKDRISRASERYEQKVSRINERVEQKKEILKEAEELAASNNWKETNKIFEELHDVWNDIGNAGDQESELWKQFSSIRRGFDSKRREYFKNLDSNRANSAQIKEELIAKAQEVMNSIKDWKISSDRMNELMEEWKKAGHAGKGKDDELWEKFNGLRKSFFDQRKEHFENLEVQYKESIAKKESLIEKAKEIAATADFSKGNTEAMKNLDKEWKSAGYSGRDKNDSLWETFKEVKNQFWDGKHADTQKRFKEIVDKKQELLSSQREQLNTLEESVFETDDYTTIHNIERKISEKKDFIETLKQDIEDISNKIQTEDEPEAVEETVKEEVVEETPEEVVETVVEETPTETVEETTENEE